MEELTRRRFMKILGLSAAAAASVPGHRDEKKPVIRPLRSKYKEDAPGFAFNKVINEFWDYDEAARLKAIEISHAYRKSRDKSRQKQGSRKKKG